MKDNRVEFTKKMKKTHTIFLPLMLPYHNRLLQAAFNSCGYHLEIMPESENLVNLSLPYMSGDYCLPAILILGQMMDIVKSGKYDVNHIAFMEPQTGGACRAGNYYNVMIKSLREAGFYNIPVISLNAFGDEKHSGFTITPKLLFSAIAAVCYSDLLMTLYQQVRPNEVHKGETDHLLKYWQEYLYKEISEGNSISRKSRKTIYEKIVNDFQRINVSSTKKDCVGIVGEIYIKFSPLGNDHLEEFLKDYGYSYRMGGFINYIIYLVDSEHENQLFCGAGKAYLKVVDFVKKYLLKLQKELNQIIEEQGRFTADAAFYDIKKKAENIINYDCFAGDGWLIAAEIADLIEKGCKSILVVHPFGCLVSHTCERGIIKNLRERYRNINIQTIEYDYDSSKTLRESRILLGLSNIEECNDDREKIHE